MRTFFLLFVILLLGCSSPNSLDLLEVTKTLTPTFSPTPTFTPTSTTVPLNLEIENYIETFVNDYRTSNGRRKLILDTQLSKIARAHSIDMSESNFFEHDNLKGQSPSDRAKAASYICGNPSYIEGIAENIAQNFMNVRVKEEIGVVVNGIHYSVRQITEAYYTTSSQVARALVNQWIYSTGHRENMLTEDYIRMGTGVAIESKGGFFSKEKEIYATQNFC